MGSEGGRRYRTNTNSNVVPTGLVCGSVITKERAKVYSLWDRGIGEKKRKSLDSSRNMKR